MFLCLKSSLSCFSRLTVTELELFGWTAPLKQSCFLSLVSWFLSPQFFSVFSFSTVLALSFKTRRGQKISAALTRLIQEHPFSFSLMLMVNRVLTESSAETLRNNDVLWLCVSESDCQSQISVGCRRSGNIRNLSAVVRVCLWKGCDVFVAEKKSRTVLFPHFLPLGGEEERRRRKWGSESCLLLDWPAWLSVVWLVCDCCVSSSSEQFYNLCRLCDWLNQLSVCPVRPSDWPVECFLPAECNRACCWSSCGSTSGLYMLISVWI